MDIKLTFLGAAGNVTGSCYLIETGNKRILVDCGMFQEWKHKHRNWDEFHVDPASIDVMLLTHAHLDHCGRIPKLVKEGFKGKIYTTRPSAEIARIVMLDAGKIQEEDAAYKKKRHAREGRTTKFPPLALYTYEDAQDTLSQFRGVEFDEKFSPCKGVTAEFRTAGHILGAASIKLKIRQGDETRTVLFSGDIGRWNAPLLKDPLMFKKADYVVVESTYGNRDHEHQEDIPEKLAAIINHAVKEGGNVVIPSFAVERSQDLLYFLSILRHEKKIPPILVMVDSPMAIRVTEIFKKHRKLFDKETQKLMKQGRHPCDFPGLEMCRSVEESKSINQIRGTAIIIAGSGMCTGGRIKHHLNNNLSRSESTILFVGYQADGTPGRELIEGAETIRLFGQQVPVKATIAKLNGFSGHADRNDLHKWVDHLETKPRKIFITHGEPKAAGALAEHLRGKDYEVHLPEYCEQVELD